MNQQTKPTCGGCQHWVRDGGEGITMGDCYFNPPYMLPSQGKTRPRMRDNERACGQHKPLEAGQESEVRGKFQPPTAKYMTEQTPSSAAPQPRSDSGTVTTAPAPATATATAAAKPQEPQRRKK